MNNRAFKDNVQNILAMSDAEARAAKAADSYISVMKHTPDVILNNVEGSQDLEVIIRFDALYLAARADGALDGNYHDLGAEITTQLPQLISDPDAIVRMDNGRLNIFAEMKTDQGRSGIISIELNTVKDINSKYSKYNLIVSAFSAKDNYVRNLLQKRAERVEYIKKDLSQVNHQLHESLAIINERTNGRSTTNNSISQTDGNVNPSDKSDSRTSIDDNKRYSLSRKDSEGKVLSQGQRDYFKDSKAVDEEGGLLRVYHGSKASPTVFSSDFISAGWLAFGKGFYFTEDKTRAQRYGKSSLYECYLNIKNELYDELITAIAGTSSDFMSDYTRRDDVGNILANCATARPLTIESIKRIFERETKGYDLGYKFNDKLAEQALLLFESLKRVPTTYFEAKPRRAVGLDEIKAVLLPNTASERVKTALTDKGIPYTQYDATDVNARREIIEKMENIRFSRKLDTYTKKQYNDFGWVRANNILTYRQWSDFNHKFENMTEEVKRRQTKNGEYMIAVNDMKDKKFGVDNVIVFAKGTPLHPVVTKIIEINLEYETLIEAIREFIYEHEGNIDKGVFDGMLQIYNSKDFAHSTQQSGRGQAIEIDSPLRNGRRGTRSDSDDGDDGNKGGTGRFSRVRSFQSADEDIRYSIRTKEPPKKTITAYKVFYAKDGGLYPPMVANPGGEPTPVGVWLDADVGEMAGTSATGRLQVKSGGKGTQGRGGKLAFRPGWHLGEYPKATQFNRLDPKTGKRDLFPKDFVWARCEIAADVDYQSEAESYGYTENGKYRHSYAGLPKVPEDGYYVYRTNPDPATVPWYITGAMRVVEILDDNDVRRILQEHGQEPVQRQGGDIDLAQYGLRKGEVDDLRWSRKKQDDHKFYHVF